MVGANWDPPTCVRKAVWGMLCADDAGIVSKSAEGLSKRMTVVVVVFKAAGLAVSEKKTDHATANTGVGTLYLTARH